MPSKIVDLDAMRPHRTGAAECTECGHKWTAIAPIGTMPLQCPECMQLSGVFEDLMRKDGEHWQCPCGCELFRITPVGAYCPMCGLDQRW